MLNPISYTEKIIQDFLSYQLTAYSFTDPNLREQLRQLLNLAETRQTPLVRGPYISLSRGFQQGASVADLVREQLLHPHLESLVARQRNTAGPHYVYGHQEQAFKALAAQKHLLVSTGTGSGKTECFFYPIISKCLQLRDAQSPTGIVAIIIYPMNALAEDQLERLRSLLAGTGITFGMYVGKTVEQRADVVGRRLPAGASAADYEAEVKKLNREGKISAVHPPEELVSREEMRATPPRILLTNTKQLELLLTRQKDVELFNGLRLDFLVVDEAHTFSGAEGAETAYLLRRVQDYAVKERANNKSNEGVNKKSPQTMLTQCIATSATIVTGKDDNQTAVMDFVHRLFGVERGKVAVIKEAHAADLWAKERKLSKPLAANPQSELENLLEVVSALEKDRNSPMLSLLKKVFQRLTGNLLDLINWESDLYRQLAANETVYQLAQLLEKPGELGKVVNELSKAIGHRVTAEEVLMWLSLGAISRLDGRPLLRPVVHCFVKGVAGAVVTFPLPRSTGAEHASNTTEQPQLWLAADSIPENHKGLFTLSINTCATCGQHYFVHAVEDLIISDKGISGGQLVGRERYWRTLSLQRQGRKVLLLDHLLSQVSDEEELDAAEMPATNYTKSVKMSARRVPKDTLPMYFCRYCGSLHETARERCLGCGQPERLVALLAVKQKLKKSDFDSSAPVGQLDSCLACGTRGSWRVGGYREPVRPVRAIAVADVHVLAQSMLQHAEKKRLLVFADNRQEAAFQAGWMQDHARRYRLRALMYHKIKTAPISVGDLTAHLDKVLNNDDELSQALVPEVWQGDRKEAAGSVHEYERKYFLRIQVLRELTLAPRERIGLEPWGRLRVDYLNLINADLDRHPFWQRWARAMQTTPAILAEGVAAMLDGWRRRQMLLDRDGKIFSKVWLEGDKEIQRGYLPLLVGGPKSLRLQDESQERSKFAVTRWWSNSETLAKQIVRRWGLDAENVPAFLTALWELLTTELQLLVPVILTGSKGNPLPNLSNTYQIDADRLLLSAVTSSRGVYRCQVCQRRQPRRTPQMACMSWRCKGQLEWIQEDPEDYDLMVLDQEFTLLRPREHSAQIPVAKREEWEREFKGEKDSLNTLVCTPTLEMGVDIGALDAVLMRNVPPLPANYWQRAGRAGRRHRMAVNITYARATSHDRAYFNEPLKMLAGAITPPRFNLRNELMIRKHVHAAIITLLHRAARQGESLSPAQRSEIKETLATVFPGHISNYLFEENGDMRKTPFDVQPLTTLIATYQKDLTTAIKRIFEGRQAAETTSSLAGINEKDLATYLLEMTNNLQIVINRLFERLQWANQRMEDLENKRRKKAALDNDEDLLYQRCKRTVSRLKGNQNFGAKNRRLDEQDTSTYGLLALEGFLPSYGLDIGTVLGYYQISRALPNQTDWSFRLTHANALREYIPGNRIYVNSQSFVPRIFHLGTDDPQHVQVNLNELSIVEDSANLSSSLSSRKLTIVPICDVDLIHAATVNDSEETRFRLSVTICGYESRQQGHRGGQAYLWPASATVPSSALADDPEGGNYRAVDQTVSLQRGVGLRLVNLGVSSKIAQQELGYPVCLICGQSRSPLSSKMSLKEFEEKEHQKCNQKVARVGFFADIKADIVKLRDFNSEAAAYSVMEALRYGAAQVLDMELDDLQILVIVRPGERCWDGILYDPMPGGSGLLEQLVERWTEVLAASRKIVADCPRQCANACIDCLMNFRNEYYHQHLDRKLVCQYLDSHRAALQLENDIPQIHRIVDPQQQKSTNKGEDLLGRLLQQAGFEGYVTQQQIKLSGGKSTTPDFFFEAPNDYFAGVCIYLDGQSRRAHGTSERQRGDSAIREELKSKDYEVIEIAFGDLDDKDLMVNHFRSLGRLLGGRKRAEEIKNDTSWYDTNRLTKG